MITPAINTTSMPAVGANGAALARSELENVERFEGKPKTNVIRAPVRSENIYDTLVPLPNDQQIQVIEVALAAEQTMLESRRRTIESLKSSQDLYSQRIPEFQGRLENGANLSIEEREGLEIALKGANEALFLFQKLYADSIAGWDAVREGHESRIAEYKAAIERFGADA